MYFFVKTIFFSWFYFQGLSHAPCQNGSDFVTNRTILDCPTTIDPVAVSSSDNTLVGGNKDQILELIRDRVLTPRNYEGIEFLNYFVKAEWSLAQLKNGPLRSPRCVLATLTSTFQLVIYGQSGDVTNDYQRNWTPLLNVSKTANMILRQKWESENPEGTSSGIHFEEYKERIRELTCVDFAWMPRLDDNDGGEVDIELFLVVAHANGSIDIWWIFTSPETGNLVAEIIYTKSVLVGEIISAMKIQALDTRVGVLAIGTNSGIVRIFRIERDFEGSMEVGGEEELTTEKRKPAFIIKDGVEIWGEDGLRIDTFMCTMLPAEDRNILKRVTVDFLFRKHPYHLCSCSVSVFADGLAVAPVEHIKVPEGPIVGLQRYSDDLLMCCHESGVLSLVYHKNGNLKYVEGSANSIREGTGPSADVYGYNGFVFSTNRGLAFIGKHLKCLYDHNFEKEPGKLLVFSTLPSEDTWNTVKDCFRANECSLEKISDILLGFRHQLRTRQELDIDQFLDGPGHLEIAPDLLKVYLWILRALYLPGDEETRDDVVKLRKIAAVYQRQQEVEDDILQRYYISLLESIDETILSRLTLAESQSLFLIQQFLNSKPNLRHLSFEPAIIPEERPKCIICGNEYDFLDPAAEDGDPLAENHQQETEEEEAMRIGKIPGFEWTKQQCTEKHFFPVCILTLLPCNFPYRTCETCGVVCSAKPVFELVTECPLCGDPMKLSDSFAEIEEGEGDEEDSESIREDPPGIRFLGVKAESGISAS